MRVLAKALLMFAAAVVGAVAVTAAGIALIMATPARNDGQSAMIIFFTVPLGAVLGALWAARK